MHSDYSVLEFCSEKQIVQIAHGLPLSVPLYLTVLYSETTTVARCSNYSEFQTSFDVIHVANKFHSLERQPSEKRPLTEQNPVHGGSQGCCRQILLGDRAMTLQD